MSNNKDIAHRMNGLKVCRNGDERPLYGLGLCRQCYYRENRDRILVRQKEKDRLRRGKSSFMKPPIVNVWDRHTFEKRDISQEFHFVVSIQEYDEVPNIVRPDFRGERLDLYFYDVADPIGGHPLKSDIDQLMVFSEKWVRQAKEDPFLARLVVHCFAGISRSPACAMLPLCLYFGDYQLASEHLYDRYPNVQPNTLILKMIKELLGYSY